MNRVELGFVEKGESWKLESRFFPSKVGGKPAWLNLKDLPSFNEIQCNVCRNPCIFLCEIYAPFEENSQAFHRTLYVFICKNVACQKPNMNENLKVFRCQLSRENIFYPYEPPDEDQIWRTDIQTEKWVKTCRPCGILATSHCAKCKRVNYCCRSHQVLDWKATHKQECSADSTNESITVLTSARNINVTFPEYEIVMETEMKKDLENDADVLAEEKQEIERFNSLMNIGKAGTLQSEKDIDMDLENMSQTEDETFANFRETVKNNPDQVLRYDRGGKPLYISSSYKPSHIPKCEYCNGDRQFEFQIMPQLLNYLDLDDLRESLDWGILLIFTCKNSCDSKSAYTAEYIWKQDIVEVTSKTIVKD